MTPKRAFISFDFDNDANLRDLLVGQARNSDSPFEIRDYSIKEPLSGDWKNKVRRRMANIDVVIVICGTSTHNAIGVSDELAIARDAGKPYFLLNGRKDRNCTRPKSALSTDKVYNWTWDNLKNLIQGAR